MEFSEFKQQYMDMVAHAKRKRPNYNPGFVMIEQDEDVMIVAGSMMASAVNACMDEFTGKHEGTPEQHQIVLDCMKEYFKVPPTDVYEMVLALRAYEHSVAKAIEAGLWPGLTITKYKLRVAMIGGLAMLVSGAVDKASGKKPDMTSVDMSQFDGIVASFKEQNNGGKTN